MLTVNYCCRQQALLTKLLSRLRGWPPSLRSSESRPLLTTLHNSLMKKPGSASLILVQNHSGFKLLPFSRDRIDSQGLVGSKSWDDLNFQKSLFQNTSTPDQHTRQPWPQLCGSSCSDSKNSIPVRSQSK